MNVLLLGGTGIAGDAIARALLDADHTITVAQRSASPLASDPRVREVRLDRTLGDHGALAEGAAFGAVIDNSGFVPAVVRDALAKLDRPGMPWVFVSSTSVFRDNATIGNDERSPTHDIADPELRARALADPAFDWRAEQQYAACKALCELELAGRDGPTAILRPCVIGGAGDQTWRFPYWVERGSRGGTIVAPSPKETPVAVVDARDLADFAVRCIEEQVEGTFVLAPDPSLSTFEDLLAAVCDLHEGTAPTVEWAPPELLRAHEVEPWAELPFWLPPETGFQGMNAYDCTTSFEAGFTPRPLRETARWTLEWLHDTPAEQWPPRGQVLAPERERELLAALSVSTSPVR